MQCISKIKEMKKRHYMIQCVIRHCIMFKYVLCTVAKGLEFDNVLLIDVNEGMIPYNKADTKEGLEEERRLFYAVVTRGKAKTFYQLSKKI